MPDPDPITAEDTARREENRGAIDRQRAERRSCDPDPVMRTTAHEWVPAEDFAPDNRVYRCRVCGTTKRC